MIRPATKDDKLEFLLLCKEFLKESSYPFSMSVKKVSENFNVIVDHPDFHVEVIEEKGELVGFLVAGLVTPMFSDDIVSSELAWFVSPIHRGSSDSMRLLSRYEKWAKKKGCKFITMVDIDSLNNLEDIYSRRGYKLTEKTYVKEL